MAELALAYRLVQCWDALQAGQFLTEAGAAVGTSRATVRRMLRAAGGSDHGADGIFRVPAPIRSSSSPRRAAIDRSIDRLVVVSSQVV